MHIQYAGAVTRTATCHAVCCCILSPVTLVLAFVYGDSREVFACGYNHLLHVVFVWSGNKIHIFIHQAYR